MVQLDPDPELLFCSEEPFTPDVQVETELKSLKLWTKPGVNESIEVTEYLLTTKRQRCAEDKTLHSKHPGSKLEK